MITMTIGTGISITISCILIAALLKLLGDEREDRYREEEAARAERHERFKQHYANILLMQEKRDETFWRGYWFERVEDRRDA